MWRRAGLALAAWSVLVGVAIGFTGYYDAFKQLDRDRYRALERAFSPLPTLARAIAGGPAIADVLVPGGVTDLDTRYTKLSWDGMGWLTPGGGDATLTIISPGARDAALRFEGAATHGSGVAVPPSVVQVGAGPATSVAISGDAPVTLPLRLERVVNHVTLSADGGAVALRRSPRPLELAVGERQRVGDVGQQRRVEVALGDLQLLGGHRPRDRQRRVVVGDLALGRGVVVGVELVDDVGDLADHAEPVREAGRGVEDPQVLVVELVALPLAVGRRAAAQVDERRRGSRRARSARACPRRARREVQPADDARAPSASGCPGPSPPGCPSHHVAAAVGLHEEAAVVAEGLGLDQLRGRRAWSGSPRRASAGSLDRLRRERVADADRARREDVRRAGRRDARAGAGCRRR